MNESQNNNLFNKILDFFLPTSTPYWGLIFFVFASNFSYYLLHIHDVFILVVLFISLALVIKYKLFRKLYYYISSIFILFILCTAPVVSPYKLGWITNIDYLAWFKHFLLTTCLSFFFVKLYLMPTLKKECNKMLCILPFAYLFLVTISIILFLCFTVVYLYYNPLGDITAFVFFKAMFGITPLEELPSL